MFVVNSTNNKQSSVGATCYISNFGVVHIRSSELTALISFIMD